MEYHETNQRALAKFFAQWNYYKTINGLHDRPASERFQAFKAAFTFHDVDDQSEFPCEKVGGDDPRLPPPEYDMLMDWLRDPNASGYWEPVKERP